MCRHTSNAMWWLKPSVGSKPSPIILPISDLGEVTDPLGGHFLFCKKEIRITLLGRFVVKTSLCLHVPEELCRG